ncbi:gliding motility-associated C-terminal domain-containing protein [Nonlabens mediterrranea]|uniref:Gliding motility-associated C-terminal domain-containing protein n=1 Tax=Nonlabens mediterrranea TaxID=1419947 RepID=A0ABS0A5R3_9FLAO|nr:gliding motility-associated C-terminal domain-containing protein [Nonlabens mediterrranea]
MKLIDKRYFDSRILLIALLLNGSITLAQTALTNFGNLKVHNDGQIGFHIDVINNGDSVENEGLAGFYNQNNSLSFGGINQMNFENFEVDVDNDLNLLTSIGINDEMIFTNGRVNTPRIDPQVKLKFLNDNVYNGEGNNEHVDGYAQFNGSFQFSFPIGDDFEIKPLSIDNFINSFTYSAAYFKENPNLPTTFLNSFDTNSFEPSLDIISNVEFWYFDGEKDLDLTLTWTDSSNISQTANNLTDLRIAGWDDIQKIWVDLGNTNTTGDLNNGTITSRIVNSADYKIYTIGSILKAGNEVVVYNGMTPDGDGLNDTLIIRGIEGIPDNQLFIYNRWGRLVYKKDNYDNTFSGISNTNATVQDHKQLAAGTYYYVLKLPEQSDLAGYFYINR